MTSTTAPLPAAGAAPHDFLPPQTQGFGGSLAMALLVHALLVGALTWGIAWKRDPQTPVIAAELWSALPVQAAPKEQEAPPPPPPPPEPARRTDPPPPTEADIALERARKQEQERKAREEAQRKAEQKKAEQKKADDKKAAERREQERKLADDKKRKEEQRKDDERKREADAQKQREAQAAKQREALRDEQLRRMQGLAGATGNEQSTGSAQRSAGPSASYAGRIVARVKPNIVFTDTVSGNPEAEVEVRAAPDGTIVGKRVVKSSGVKAWDEAVLRALDRTEVLPRDVDGRIPSTMILVFRPRD